MPLPQALERLSAATGERWTCAKALGDEVLFVRLVDAPPERVKRVVEKLFDAQWTDHGSERLLVPDPAAARLRSQRNEAARQARIVAGLDRLRVELKKLPPHFTSADAKAYGIRHEAWSKKVEDWMKGSMDAEPPSGDDLTHETPSWRVAATAALALPARDYEQLSPGARVVYGDHPTPMQRPMPATVFAALAQYRREAPAYLDGKVPFRHRFVVTRRDQDAEGEIQVEFQSIDDHGEGIESESIDIDGAPDEPSTAGPAKRMPLEKDIVDHAALLTSDEDSHVVRDAQFAEWSAKLQDPVRYEPLRWGTGAAVLACAQRNDEALVGTATDDMTTPGPELDGDSLPVNYLDLRAPMWRREEGWIVFDPPVRHPRVARSVARDHIRRAVAEGGLTLDQASEWTASLPAEADDWTAAVVAILTNSQANCGEADDLRLWAALGGGARADLRAGHSVLLSALPSSARQYLQTALFRNADPERLEGVDGIEPTERFPRGVSEAVLTLQSRTSTAAFAWNAAAGEPVWRTLYPVSILGGEWGRSDAAGKSVEPDRFRLTERRSTTLTVAYAPDASLAYRFFETLSPPGGPVVDALPDDLAKAFEAARARGRAALRRVKPESTLRVASTPPWSGSRTRRAPGSGPRRCRCW